MRYDSHIVDMRRVKWLLRFTVGLLIGIVVLELCARLDDYISYGAPPWSVYNVDTLWQRDSLGWKGKPGARYKQWQLNSLGYRGPELIPGRIPIVCLGASETFGLYEGPGQEYPRQLERILNARAGGKYFEVVNVSLAGETVRSATRRVPEIVQAIHPRIALIYPSVAGYIWLPWLHTPPADTQPPPQRFQWRIGENLRELLKQALPSVVQNWLREQEIERFAALYPVMDRVPEENIRVFRSDVEALVDSLRSHEVQPVLVTHATRFGRHLSLADRRLLVSWRKFYPMLREGGFLDMEERMNDALREVAAQRGVLLIDAAREVPPGEQNFADYAHFTAAGAQIMADRLADGLQPLLVPYLEKEAASTAFASGAAGGSLVSNAGRPAQHVPAVGH